jgi:hypothetical protein
MKSVGEVPEEVAVPAVGIVLYTLNTEARTPT